MDPKTAGGYAPIPTRLTRANLAVVASDWKNHDQFSTLAQPTSFLISDSSQAGSSSSGSSDYELKHRRMSLNPLATVGSSRSAGSAQKLASKSSDEYLDEMYRFFSNDLNLCL